MLDLSGVRHCRQIRNLEHHRNADAIKANADDIEGACYQAGPRERPQVADDIAFDPVSLCRSRRA